MRRKTRIAPGIAATQGCLVARRDSNVWRVRCDVLPDALGCSTVGAPACGARREYEKNIARYRCSRSSVQQHYRPVYRNSIHLQRADNPSPTQIAGQLTTHRTICCGLAAPDGPQSTISLGAAAYTAVADRALAGATAAGVARTAGATWRGLGTGI